MKTIWILGKNRFIYISSHKIMRAHNKTINEQIINYKI